MNHSPTQNVLAPSPSVLTAAPLRGSRLVELVSASESKHGQDYCRESLASDSWELMVVVRGHVALHVNDQDCEAGPVDAMLLAPGVKYSERCVGEMLQRLHVAFEWRDTGADLPLKVQDTSGRLHEVCSWLVAEQDAHFDTVDAYRYELLRTLLAEYHRLSVVAASRVEERTRSYMLRHLGESITLDDLANNIGMSRYYFCRVYKDMAGRTPMEHLRSLRLERAKDLIRSTALPLKAIAPEVGFGSAQHLCRLLHDRFGVGVRELRGAGDARARSLGGYRGRARPSATSRPPS